MGYNSAWCLFHSSDVLLKEKIAKLKSKAGGAHFQDSELNDFKQFSSSEDTEND